MRSCLLALFYLLPVTDGAAAADEPQPPAAAEGKEHEELRAVRKGLVDAYNKRDLDALISYCHPGIVITWQNAEVTSGREQLRAYYDKMLNGPDSIVVELNADPTVDDVSTIYGGDVAVARGAMNDKYQLRDGSDFAMNSRWSATLVKEDGKWLVAAFHASVNAFDNGILWMICRRAMWWTGGVTLLVGMVAGFLVGRSSGRRRVATL